VAAARKAARPRIDALERAAAGELLGPRDIAAIWGFGHSRFAVLNGQGAFDFLKVSPAIGPRCFSGVKVTRYLAGEPLERPVFGRKVAAWQQRAGRSA
jgi:hypothetical protein